MPAGETIDMFTIVPPSYEVKIYINVNASMGGGIRYRGSVRQQYVYGYKKDAYSWVDMLQDISLLSTCLPDMHIVKRAATSDDYTIRCVAVPDSCVFRATNSLDTDLMVIYNVRVTYIT